MRTTGPIAKYGKIALALAAIFLSGQAIGWMLALHSCEARQESAADTARWSDQMMARLQDDLDLTSAQTPEVKSILEAVSSRMQRKRDSALFQIHLELIKTHDDLAPGLSSDQRKKLDASRKKLVRETTAKFPEFLRETEVPAAARDPASPTPP